MQAVPRLKDANSRVIAGNVKMVVMLLWERAWGGGGLVPERASFVEKRNRFMDTENKLVVTKVQKEKRRDK